MTNQANQAKHEQERWEDFLDTVFARSSKIESVCMGSAERNRLETHMQKMGYGGLCQGLLEDPPNLWGIPVVIDHNCSNSPRIVYKEGVMSPEPNPKIKAEKPVNTWLDDEV